MPSLPVATLIAALSIAVPMGCATKSDQPLVGGRPIETGPKSLSVGEAFGGALVDGIRMPEGQHWELVDPKRAWGTRETIAFLETAITTVAETCVPAHPLFIGHISNEDGGPLWPHRSHQSGRDVDLSFYYRGEALIGWYQRANAYSLDEVSTWALLRAFITEADVEYIFIDRSVQRLLRRHALDVGEDPDWLATVFQVGSRDPSPIVRHASGHATHMHVRFYNRHAQRRGAQRFDELIADGTIGGRRHPRLRRPSALVMAERPKPPSAVVSSCAREAANRRHARH